MTTRRAESLALTLLTAAILGCGASGANSGATQPSGTAAAGSPDLAGYIQYSPTTVDPNAATAAYTSLTCSSPSGAALSVDSTATGIFSVSMVDAPALPNVKEIWVNVVSVSAHVVGLGWVPLMDKTDPPVDVDLLKLQNGVTQALGFVTIPAGTVTQIRLVVAPDASAPAGVGGSGMANYVVVQEGVDANNVPILKQYPLKVPSGYESGIKIMGPWQVAGCTRTDVTLDFDGKESIWYHPLGTGNRVTTEWILRPVIRVKGVKTSGTSCTPTTPPPSCTADADCASKSCVAGVCTTKPGGESCTVDAECTSNSCAAGVCTPKPNGQGCTADTECASNSCVSNVCTAKDGTNPPPPPPPSNLPIGSKCTAPSDCASGVCSSTTGLCSPPGGAGTTCGGNTECLSNDCFKNTCGVSPNGGACNVDMDCTKGTVCGSTGYCVPAQAAPPPSPIGAACKTPVECMSGSCSGTETSPGTCQPGGQGAVCAAGADCMTGFFCGAIDPCTKLGVCQPMTTPTPL